MAQSKKISGSKDNEKVNDVAVEKSPKAQVDRDKDAGVDLKKEKRDQVVLGKDPLGNDPISRLSFSSKMGSNWVLTWKRPDEISSCLNQGYKLVTDKDATAKQGMLKTINGTANVWTLPDRRAKGSGYSPGLILMAVPRDLREQSLKYHGKESRDRYGGFMEQAKENLRREYLDPDKVPWPSDH